MSAEIAQKVKELVVKQLAVAEDQVTEDARFVEDLNADSLDIVEMIMALEEEFNSEIPDEEAEGLKTVGDAIKANWKIANPALSPSVAVMVALRSRGGVPTAKQQLHRARAMFDTWHEKYPDYNLDGMPWRGL